MEPQPTAFRFYQPVLKVLGHLSNYQSQTTFFKTEVIPAVIREIGFDPTALPEGWTLAGRQGLSRKIGFAVRNQREGYTQIPLTIQGLKSGYWGLTDLGAAVAKQLTGLFVKPPVVVDVPQNTIIVDVPALPPRNATARWLYANYAKVHAAMLHAVNKKLSVSAAMDLGEDHVQECMLRLISRDALASRLIDGRPLAPSHLASYAVRSGYTDIRNAATDPVCREIYGARTEKERKIAAKPAPSITARHRPPVWSKNEGDGEAILADVADEKVGDISSRVTFEQLYSRIECIVQEAKPEMAEQYLHILNMKFEGKTVQEIADTEEVSRHRAAFMLAEVRRMCREAKDEGEFDEFLQEQDN